MSCHNCKKCGQHWGGEHGQNNAHECCKFLDQKEVLNKQRYWRKQICPFCNEKMTLT